MSLGKNDVEKVDPKWKLANFDVIYEWSDFSSENLLISSYPRNVNISHRSLQHERLMDIFLDVYHRESQVGKGKESKKSL